ncbi:hypothetical protein N7493_009897 [Penicillium malachiteum]|uniref:Uncharacterized protein n=1 Tax=Penicillium malachiteum TaxID=1324776 RepID=A0AAD6HDR7_9EURO|nr:hypothetical protein N7493_009897 [Penicillium malachiteum]
MFFLFVLCFLVGHSLASSNSTALVGWQLDDNSRSTWDIVWSCLSTIFACTWTVLHINVYPRNISNKRWIVTKLVWWLIAIVIPEVLFWAAAYNLYWSILLQKVCNAAQNTRDSDSSEPKLWLSKRAIPLGQAQDLCHIDLHPVHTEWTIRQCFCIRIRGLALQTQDEWIYTIRPSDMKPFIQAGLIRCSDFRDRDVEDRAKSDSFAKAFTLLQSTWFLCNCIGRWAYSLPISPIELATVAYVGCGVLTYAAWWYKPKDMTTPITIYLRFDRKNLPAQVCNLTEQRQKGWVHLRARVKEEREVYDATTPPSDDEPDEPGNDQPDDYAPFEKPLDGILLSIACTSAALIYCAIHVAAWNFEFPTKAEQIIWRVLSLIAVGTVFIFSALQSLEEYTSFLKSKNMLPSFMTDYDRKGGRVLVVRPYVVILCFFMYIPARLWMMGLVFSSLRALPAATYTTVDWLTAIPHF